MKNLIIIIVCIQATSLSAQSLDSSLINDYYQKIIFANSEYEIQNWMDENRELPEGIYYYFEGRINKTDGKNSVEMIIHIRHQERIIGFLMALGIQLEEAWYRPHKSSCRGFDVGVPASLLIRVKTRFFDDSLEKLGFSYTEFPSIGNCPYDVRHYTFE